MQNQELATPRRRPVHRRAKPPRHRSAVSAVPPRSPFFACAASSGLPARRIAPACPAPAEMVVVAGQSTASPITPDLGRWQGLADARSAPASFDGSMWSRSTHPRLSMWRRADKTPPNWLRRQRRPSIGIRLLSDAREADPANPSARTSPRRRRIAQSPRFPSPPGGDRRKLPRQVAGRNAVLLANRAGRAAAAEARPRRSATGRRSIPSFTPSRLRAAGSASPRGPLVSTGC